MDDVTFLPAHQLAQAIRQREVSSAEIVEAHLNRITKYNPALNAIVTLDAERARVRARELDAERARGKVRGALHGVPVTIKDAFETKGLRTTFGYLPTRNYVPKRNATVVARLLAAGAVILGKTNIPDSSFDWQSKNVIFGRTNNPWDLRCTPGGSTGGGAAAVAAGLSPLEIGSDAAGSIRFPAHCCGVYGLKPTEHLVSGAGHMLIPRGAPRGVRHTASFGPLARSIEDLRLALRIIAGPDNCQPEVPPVPLDLFSQKRPAKQLSECRIGWTDDFGGVPVTMETRAVLKNLMEKLQAKGCHIQRASPKGFDFSAALETCGEIAGAEMGAQMQSYARVALRPMFQLMFGRGAWTRGFTRGLSLKMRRYVAALTRRDVFIAAMENFLDDWDAWLCPVAAVHAFTHRWKGTRIAVDDEKLSYSVALGSYTSIFNLTGNPVVVLPVTRSECGLPIGVQAVGARWKDMPLLDTAELIASVTEGFQPPPTYV